MSKKDIENKVEDSQVEGQATATEEVEGQEEIKSEEDTKSVEEQLQEQVAFEKDKFIRLFAEFENYKRRTNQERVSLYSTANRDVVIALLPVLDDFERALSHIDDDKEAEELRKGVLLIYNKLVDTLEKKGLSKIEVKQGDAFDADHHDAVTQIPAPSEDLKGKIIDVVERGYKLGDKVIRFPKVVIGQ
ncbi:nucleotide exchange factor GrpE [Winogradskyella sp. F6397]|uniref:Protein GrpE n=1 Tax=Winogradskyella marina TaxID=2785530 RepID=A0ABS0EM09_9FLAO|nr:MULTISPECIES: nucleotide exchange factor GrpE [Winogradskyella]MBF8151491.1 nucleotide exchange factor GrpE [Winogradskyella marina]